MKIFFARIINHVVVKVHKKFKCSRKDLLEQEKVNSLSQDPQNRARFACDCVKSHPNLNH